ncbi:aldehyde dehydrogenase family protein [Emticicia sp. CRIBPO]|uniref:aldehyde dehydrogenase family protein n=1 Tax=Emticicia sp. CRIBPO TaxID=2683258 RepID=UPI001412161E|nr:aldehyde dehydrogenase family protein [Emticicia sp. CRIBPO]NBA88493.1 aldehyde dehydrogenase family protein [Emticicia sp. CRIBPO]
MENQDLEKLFNLQKENLHQLAQTTTKERIRKIKKVKEWILSHQEELHQSLYLDFRKSMMEVKVAEVLPVVGEANYIISNLKKWMRPEVVDTPLKLIGTSSKIYREPKGNCLIISPWNYPVNLSIKPLLQAIAAGNAVILKPSEMTPNTSLFMKKMVNELFDPSEVEVVLGDAKVAMELQKLKFNHIFFTGSPAVGKLVMQAAAKNLCSVTLELGGKSPSVVDEKCDIRSTAKKLACGKFLNNAQTCIAPDYLLVHESVKNEFLTALKEAFEEFGGGDLAASPDYCRIVNNQHFQRLEGILEDAKGKGAKVAFGGKVNGEDNFIEPTALADVTDDMRILQEELFGPLIPIKTFSHIDECVDYINAGEKPLALYYFGNKSGNLDRLIQGTSSGAVVVNDTAIHYLHSGLPFGGINNSGIGKAFGWYGFMEFTNLKPVMKNHFYMTNLIFPPYDKTRSKVIDLLIKYLA